MVPTVRTVGMVGAVLRREAAPPLDDEPGDGERDRAGLRINEMVASGELSAPIVIGRDHLDSGSVA